MNHKLLINSFITFLILFGINPFKIQAEEKNTNNGLLNKFCVATLKSKLEIKDKTFTNEITDFTCKCFFKKYNSGFSIKNARIYCREKTSEKYNLY